MTADTPARVSLEHYPAYFTCDDDEDVGPLYYFAVANRTAPPYKTQREVSAIIDIAADGTLAGVELIYNMPPMPPQPTTLTQAQAERIAALEQGMAKSNEDVCQTLGKALGYPWFKDDPTNFPGSTEEHGVCVGEHVAESIAAEAARKIAALEAEVARLTSDNEGLTKHLDDCVQERLDEMSVEAADFDKEVWRALCSYLKDRKGFSWHDYQDGIHAEDVIEFLRCCDEAAESSLAETRAKVEGLEKIVEELRPMIDADGKFNTLVWAERQPRLLAALSALPEAKPAAQAEGE